MLFLSDARASYKVLSFLGADEGILAKGGWGMGRETSDFGSGSTISDSSANMKTTFSFKWAGKKKEKKEKEKP